MDQKGWLKSNKEKWWQDNPYKKHCRVTEDKIVGIIYENLIGVYLVIFVGIAFSVCIIFCEFVYFKIKKCMKKMNISLVPSFIVKLQEKLKSLYFINPFDDQKNFKEENSTVQDDMK